MSDTNRAASSIYAVLIRYIVLAALYVLLILVLPVSSNTTSQYDISTTQYKFINLAIAIPSLIVWFLAFISYAKLQDYAHTISDTTDGLSFKKLATGCTWLAWAFPLPTVIALLLNGASYRHPGFHSFAIIAGNYIAVIMPLIAFILIGLAATSLSKSSSRSASVKKSRAIIIIFALLGLLYCYVTFNNFEFISINSANNPYNLPLWLVTITVIIPSLYGWFTGLLAASDIMSYSAKVYGTVYRQALQLLVGGVVLVIISLIALQYIISASPIVNYLVLDYKIVVMSLFRILAGIGFGMVAIGATKLHRIEKV